MKTRLYVCMFVLFICSVVLIEAEPNDPNGGLFVYDTNDPNWLVAGLRHNVVSDHNGCGDISTEDANGERATKLSCVAGTLTFEGDIRDFLNTVYDTWYNNPPRTHTAQIRYLQSFYQDKDGMIWE